MPRSNRSSAVFTFSIVHTLWYVVVVVVAPPAVEAGAAVTAHGFVAAATGKRLRSLGAGGHACFCRDTLPACCTCAHKKLA